MKEKKTNVNIFDRIQNKLFLISFNNELNKSGGLRGK